MARGEHGGHHGGTHFNLPSISLDRPSAPRHTEPAAKPEDAGSLKLQLYHRVLGNVAKDIEETDKQQKAAKDPMVKEKLQADLSRKRKFYVDLDGSLEEFQTILDRHPEQMAEKKKFANQHPGIHYFYSEVKKNIWEPMTKGGIDHGGLIAATAWFAGTVRDICTTFVENYTGNTPKEALKQWGKAKSGIEKELASMDNDYKKQAREAVEAFKNHKTDPDKKPPHPGPRTGPSRA